jgi:glycosyltransferase involved in cell wall biosynthesis
MDVHHLRIESQLKNNPNCQKLRQETIEIETLEKKLWEQVDVLLYPTQSETEYIRSYLGKTEGVAQCRTMPVFYWESFPDSRELSANGRNGLFYVAGFSHPPNVEGILWFIEKVFPLILKKVPNCILTIAGSNPPPKIINLESENIKILGFISDEQLKLNYKSKRVAIAPLLSGAGMKGKVAEALKNGLPIVTTSFGAQGFEEESYAVPALNEPHRMAAKICTLLQDDREWLDVAIKGVNFAKKKFSEKNMWNTLRDLIE